MAQNSKENVMKVVKSFPDGIFGWVDLSTTDVAGAKAFYSALFGWDFVDPPAEGPEYYMAQIEGYNVAGMGPLPPDMAAGGFPPAWFCYVKHSDIDAVIERATAAGGQVMMPAMDILDSGRLGMIQDPTGAVLGLWQPQNHTGAQLVNMPNALTWNELQTREGEAAKAFYHAVFGWTHSTDPTGYVVFAQDGRNQAGMIIMDDSWDANIPSNWSAYFGTEDVAAAVAKVEELGGRVLVPPTPAGSMGHFAVVSDPQGGVFTIIQYTAEGGYDPPPGY